MAIRDIFKISRKTFFNPSAWLGVGYIREQTRIFWSILSQIFYPPETARKETFEEAKNRLGLTEADIASLQQRYQIYALSFALLGLLVFLYAFFLLFHYGTLLGWFLGMAVTGLFLVQGFRFDFWALQIKHRKFGLSLADWKQHILGKGVTRD